MRPKFKRNRFEILSASILLPLVLSAGLTKAVELTTAVSWTPNIVVSNLKGDDMSFDLSLDGNYVVFHESECWGESSYGCDNTLVSLKTGKRIPLLADRTTWTSDGRLICQNGLEDSWFNPKDKAPKAKEHDFYTPVVRLISPSSGKKIVFHDRFAVLDDGPQDVKLSDDGRDLWVLTNLYWRHFNAHNGRLIKRKRWGKSLKSMRDSFWGYVSLSPNGRYALMEDSPSKGSLVVDIQTDKVQHFRLSSQVRFLTSELFVSEDQRSQICRRTDGAPVLSFNDWSWQGHSVSVTGRRYYAYTKGETLNWFDLKTGQIGAYPLPTGAPQSVWDGSIQVSADHNWAYEIKGRNLVRYRLR